MGMTITEKILANAAGRDKVSPQENIWVNVDILLTHDICGPGTIGIFEEKFNPNAKVFDVEKIIIIPDHYIFTADAKAHRNIAILKDFVEKQEIPHFYEPGTSNYMGVCHVTLPEKGHVRPGEIIVGTDSHTCTHGAFGAVAIGVGNTDAAFIMGTGKIWLKVPPSIKVIFNGKLPSNVLAKDLVLHVIGDIGVDGATYCAIEFAGSTIDELSIDERMTICNMAIEAGSKNGIIAADDKAVHYVKARTAKPFTVFASDNDANYIQTLIYDTTKLQPCVAIPHSPDKKKLLSEVAGTKLTRAYIGSCTGGKISDYEAAAKIMQGRRVKIDTFIVPATTFVAQEMQIRTYRGQTLMEIFKEAGCLIGPPSCGACLGGPIDTFGRAQANEIIISTTNRNFPGRMGSKNASIYLASPYTAAASAITGVITDPADFLIET